MNQIEQLINDLLDTQDRILQKAEIVNVKLTELRDTFDAHASVEELIERYPNDQELGRAIRKRFKTNKDGNS